LFCIESFERIHRSNLIGMGVLPLLFEEGASRKTLGLDGSEVIDLEGLEDGIVPRMAVRATITRTDGSKQGVTLIAAIDTVDEVDYYRNGGILHYVLRQRLNAETADAAD
jgi:aconitate hydratase